MMSTMFFCANFRKCQPLLCSIIRRSFPNTPFFPLLLPSPSLPCTSPTLGFLHPMAKIADFKPRLAHFLRRQNALNEVASSAIWPTGLSVVAIFFGDALKSKPVPMGSHPAEQPIAPLPRRSSCPIAAPNLHVPRPARPPRLPSRRRPPSTLARTSWIRLEVDSSATDRASPRQLSHTRPPPPMMARPAVAAAAASPSSTISSTSPSSSSARRRLPSTSDPVATQNPSRRRLRLGEAQVDGPPTRQTRRPAVIDAPTVALVGREERRRRALAHLTTTTDSSTEGPRREDEEPTGWGRLALSRAAVRGRPDLSRRRPRGGRAFDSRGVAMDSLGQSFLLWCEGVAVPRRRPFSVRLCRRPLLGSNIRAHAHTAPTLTSNPIPSEPSGTPRRQGTTPTGIDADKAPTPAPHRRPPDIPLSSLSRSENCIFLQCILLSSCICSVVLSTCNLSSICF
ncbi:hypothetical protein C8R45DRAFT_1220065 [Mycena sanguinolenta]|nr:hypothetical protein C8R45DRAFT_1220065 [Mycena sanguinolenta]